MLKITNEQPLRMKKRRMFLKATHNGKKFVAKNMILQVVAQNEVSGARLGFTVTKKLGNAVQRNRIRRRLKEVARLVFKEYACDGFDYVIIARNSALDEDFAILKKDLKYLLKSFIKRQSEEEEQKQDVEISE
ncbi:MAG: ribonuclease P protein component [Alphaproteobacteria bacterium]|nr:ribonuclease P protein component [Alphaproteobacteria bacterium]